MKTFKRVLDIVIGIAALLVIAGLILYALNYEFVFADNLESILLLTDILIKYPLPILIAVICIRFTLNKTVWLILTIIFVAFALWIYFDTAGFFGLMHSIFG